MKRANGNPGKRPLTDDDVKPDLITSVPKPPATLKGRYARAEWKATATLLVGLKVLTDMDLQMLAVYCQAVQDFWESKDYIRKHGATVEVSDANGKSRYVQQRPEVVIARNAAKQIKELGGLFGLSPSDRARLKVHSPNKPTTDPLMEFASKRNEIDAGDQLESEGGADGG